MTIRTSPIPKAFVDLGYAVREYESEQATIVCFKDKEIATFAISGATPDAILEVVVSHFMRMAGVEEY